jgi:hypothetical protein
MKAGIATVASISGVLVAGSAAAMVNSQVLHNSSAPKNSVRSVAPLTVNLARPAQLPEPSETVVEVAVTAPAPEGTEGTDAAATTLADAAPAAPTQAKYRIGDAGDVTLDTAHDRLAIVSTTPNSGWKVAGAENDDDLNVRVTFRSSTLRVEFRANLLLGVVNFSVATYDLSPAVPAAEPTTTTTQSAQPLTPSDTTTTSTTTTVTEPTTKPTVPSTTRPDNHHHDGEHTTTTEPSHHTGHDGQTPTTTRPPFGGGNGEDD